MRKIPTIGTIISAAYARVSSTDLIRLDSAGGKAFDVEDHLTRISRGKDQFVQRYADCYAVGVLMHVQSRFLML